MKLGLLFMFLIYYGILSIFFLYASPYISEDYNSTITLGGVGVNETGDPTIPSSIGIGDFFVFLGFGIGLPSDTPSWFQIIFSLWQIIVLILFSGFLYQSIRGS